MPNKLLNLITTNQKALKQILKSNTKEEGFKIATEFIEDYSQDIFDQNLAELHHIMNDEMLDNGDLDTVVGGVNQANFDLKKNVIAIFQHWKHNK